MAIYDKPTKQPMPEFVESEIRKGQIFKKEDAVHWFHAHYPKIKPATVRICFEPLVSKRLDAV